MKVIGAQHPKMLISLRKSKTLQIIEKISRKKQLL
jgi:hypothetical protein